MSVESETLEGEEGTLVLLMDPGQYRLLEDTVKTETQVTGAFSRVDEIILDCCQQSETTLLENFLLGLKEVVNLVADPDQERIHFNLSHWIRIRIQDPGC